MPFVELGGLSVAVIGATGCIGKELIHELALSLPLRNMHLFATKKRVGDAVTVENKNIEIQPFLKEGLPVEIMEEIDAVFFACPASLVVAHAPTLAEEGIAIFDLTGVLGGQIGYSLPEIQPREEEFASQRICSLPSPTAVALARLFHPLKELGGWGFQASILLSASRFGMSGIEELSQQVMALFSTNEPKKKVFPEGLAFDVLPVLGKLAEDGSSFSEKQIVTELSSLLNTPEHHFRISINLAPIFSGIAGNATIAMGTETAKETILERLQEDSNLTVEDIGPSTRSLIGESQVSIGRIRTNPLVRGFDCWVACDNVAVAVSQAVKMAEYYHKIELL